jgi:hypothetical protein
MAGELRAISEVLTIAGEQSDVGAGLVRLDPEAVELDLVQPVGARRRRRTQLRAGDGDEGDALEHRPNLASPGTAFKPATGRRVRVSLRSSVILTAASARARIDEATVHYRPGDLGR